MNKSAPRTTALHQLHRELGGRLVPFAGWELPIQYEGVVAEHRWCRTSAALFDVSHMATFEIVDSESNSAGLETLTPANIGELQVGHSRYGLFTTFDGGILDDFIVTRLDSGLRVISNAARRSAVAKLLNGALPEGQCHERDDISLIALQGPASPEVMTQLCSAATKLHFMQAGNFDIAGVTITIGRCGYTGEDGFELTVPNDKAEAFARRLLDFEAVQPAGLGARDSLRLEAGLCLYGNDIDETTTPVEADLAWSIGKRRRQAADFPGAKIILDQLANGPQRLRVGIRADGRRPIRDNGELKNMSGEPVGAITSGGYGPTLDSPVAMAYVRSEAAQLDTKLTASVRGSELNCTVTQLPFTPSNYFKG